MSSFLFKYFIQITLLILIFLIILNVYSYINSTYLYRQVSMTFTLSVLIGLYVYFLMIYYLFDPSNPNYQIFMFLKFNRLFSFYLCIDSLSIIFLFLLFLLIPLCVALRLYITYNNYFFNLRFILHRLFKLEVPNYENYLRMYEFESLDFMNTSKRKKYNYINAQNSQIFIILLLLSFLILFIVFTIMDLLGFYIFFELSIIPILLLILFFGSRTQKIRAAYYIVLYTFFGAIFFLIALSYLYVHVGTTNLFLLKNYVFSNTEQIYLWILIFIPLAIKIPILPLHLWLPEAHVEAPTEGSIILAGLLLKVGGYGLIRFIFPLFPLGTSYYAPLVIALSLISILYASLIIFTQTDLKKIIAYSSIAHMNFSIVGLFSKTSIGIQGAIYLMFTHGIISSGLFLAVGLLYNRHYSRLIYYYRGLFESMPDFTKYFFILILGNFAFPGTGGFVGEFLIICGVTSLSFFITFCMIFGCFLSTVYSMLLFTRMSFNLPHIFFVENPYHHHIDYLITEEDYREIADKIFLLVIREKTIEELYPHPINLDLVPDLFEIEYFLLGFLVGLCFISGIFPSIFLSNLENISNLIYIYIL